MSDRLPGRAGLVRALLEAPLPGAASRLARAHRQLADERTARLVLERFNRLMLDDRSKAARAAHAAAALARVEKGAVCRAIALQATGVLEHWGGRSSVAATKLREAAELYERSGCWVEAGDIHRILIDVRMRSDDDEGARSAAAEAKRCYARGGGADARRRGSLAMNLGNLHHRRDEHDRALDAYARARRDFAKAGDERRVADADYNRANVLASLDRTAEARRVFERAREVYAKRKLASLRAQADFALAGLDMLEGRLDDALRGLDRARQRHAELGDTLRVAHDDMDAGEALLRLNRPAEAEEAAKRAEQFFRRAGHRSEMAVCSGILGGAALQRGRDREAVQRFRRGRKLQERLRNPVAAALLGVGEAQAETRAGRPQRALERARRAATLLERRRLVSRRARALVVGAEAALASSRPRLARDWATTARRLAVLSGDLRVAFAALMVLGSEAERRGDGAAAYRHFRAAERRVERMRRGITAEESLLAFALDKSEVYEALILNRLARGDRASVRQALAFAERGKARALAERLQEGQVDVLGAQAPRSRQLIDRLSRLEQELAVAETRLEESESTPGLRTARVSRLGELTRARMATLSQLSRHDPERAPLVGAAPPDVRESMRSLAPDELVLEYVEAGGRFHLFAVERERVTAFASLARVDEVRDIVELLRLQLSKGVLGADHNEQFGPFIEIALRRYFERLHRLLLGPVADRLEGRRLRIVPHGVLHGLPFHALERGGRALIEQCCVSYAPSLAAIRLLTHRVGPAGSPPLILGVPDRAAPLIEREIDVVRSAVRGARVFRGSRATRAALRLSERRPPLLHVACHGFYSDEGPWTGGLRLGDAWMSLSQIYEMRGTAGLVVLSGCETGRGTVYSGDEWVGLVRGFLQAGARTVVASLWEVQDDCAVALMQDFYSELAAGASVGDALATAQRRARAADPMPLGWAPFAVIGEPDLRPLERKVA